MLKLKLMLLVMLSLFRRRVKTLGSFDTPVVVAVVAVAAVVFVVVIVDIVVVVVHRRRE